MMWVLPRFLPVLNSINYTTKLNKCESVFVIYYCTASLNRALLFLYLKMRSWVIGYTYTGKTAFSFDYTGKTAERKLVLLIKQNSKTINLDKRQTKQKFLNRQ